MIFRSNNDEDARRHSGTREALVLASPVSLHDDARAEDDVPVGSNKLNALKRKLFPSRKRRHPVRIPPLVISPISTGEPVAAMDNNDNEEETVDQEAGHDVDTLLRERDEDERDFDDDLVDAIEEADRLQSASTPDETLAQMSRAIEELHQWKAEHELATQSALKVMEAKIDREIAAAPEGEASDGTLMIEHAQRNQRTAEIAREKLLLAMKEAEESLAARCPDNERVTRALADAERQSATDTVNEMDSAALLLSRLRDEVFDLGVKELSSSIQATWLHELEGAESDLGMKLINVEAFALDLDSALAQFDQATAAIELHEREQNPPAGQAAQEH